MKKQLLLITLVLTTSFVFSQQIQIPGKYLPIYPGSYWTYINQLGDTVTSRVDSLYIRDSTDCNGGYCSRRGLVPVWGGSRMWKYGSSKTDLYGKRLLYDQLREASVGTEWLATTVTHYDTSLPYRKVTAVDTSLTVRGVQFDSVIVIHEYYTGFLSGYWKADYYYAKKIGLIMSNYKVYDWNTNTYETGSRELISYSINQPTVISKTICNSYTFNNHTYTTSGVYAEALPNAQGIDSTIILNLTINKVNTFVINTSPTLTADSANSTYQWIDCNNGNTAINGETNQSYTATINGDYAVIVSAANGCVDTSGCIAVRGIGFNELLTANKIAIYPNPVLNDLNIESPGVPQVEIYNLQGILLLSENSNHISVKDLPKGLYFIKISAKNDFLKGKFIKE